MRKEIRIKALQLDKTNSSLTRLVVFLVLIMLLLNNLVSIFLVQSSG